MLSRSCTSSGSSSTPRAEWDRAHGVAARRGSRTGCWSGSATTARCARTDGDARHPPGRVGAVRGRRARASTRSTVRSSTRCAARSRVGPSARDARGRGRRGAGDRGRRVRAVPVAVRPPRTHARAGGDAVRLRASRVARPVGTGRGLNLFCAHIDGSPRRPEVPAMARSKQPHPTAVRYDVIDRVVLSRSTARRMCFSRCHRGARRRAHRRARRTAGERRRRCIRSAPGNCPAGFDLTGHAVRRGGRRPARDRRRRADPHVCSAAIPVVVACSGHAVAAGALLLFGADARIAPRGVPHRPDRDAARHGAAGRRPSWPGSGSRRASSRSRPSAPRCTTPRGGRAGFLDGVVDRRPTRDRGRRGRRWAGLPRRPTGARCG